MAELEITFSYDEGEEIFSSFSLSLQKGEHVLVLSPPGSGKTTLAHILTGALPGFGHGTLSGHFIWNGQDVLPLNAADRMTICGRVSQDTDEMMLFSSVEEEISFPLRNLGLDRREREARITDALRLFGLEAYRGVSTAELSGGEKRRLLLAILSAVDPEIHVLDESFDELSPHWRAVLAGLIRGSERTVIAFGSHELDEYEGTFDRIVSIENGRLVPYAAEPLPNPCFIEHRSEHSLEADGIAVQRCHKSSSELSAFMLRVPSFRMAGGECITLMGENGAGKSSFARVLSGLLKELEGKVLIDGRAVSARERRHRIAYLMQDPYQDLFLPTVQDELESTGASPDEVREAAALFSLSLQDYVQEMSYGRAKMLQAAVFYLLDRPFAVFDELDNAVSYDDFMRVCAAYLEKGTGLLVITHDRKAAAMLPGRKVRIAEGVLHECQ